MATKNAVATQGAAEVPALPDVYKFMALTNPGAIQENLGGEGINPFDLDRVKFPAGGGITWQVPTLSGEMDAPKALEGIIVYWRNTRSYWETDYTGESTPPSCSSVDGEKGVGNPGGSCAMCPMAQWNSGKNGGQACKAARLLFLMTKDSVLPLVVAVPPTSVGIMKKFFLRLAGQEISYHGGIMSLGLEQTKNKGGIAYSQIKPGLVKTLSAEQADAVKLYADTIKGALNQVTLEPEDVNGAGEAAA